MTNVYSYAYAPAPAFVARVCLVVVVLYTVYGHRYRFPGFTNESRNVSPLWDDVLFYIRP
jgi:hypothetical protein